MRPAVEYGEWRWEYGTPTISKGGGPERVVTDDPAPADWKPPPFLGFARPKPPPDPLTWDGDGA